MRPPRSHRDTEKSRTYNAGMFDLIEDRKKPEIKWWTIPATIFLIFCTGVDVGILIGRRSVDRFDWLQAAGLVFVSLYILSPINRELAARRTQEEKKQDVR